jgi:hypothetical protein
VGERCVGVGGRVAMVAPFFFVAMYQKGDNLMDATRSLGFLCYKKRQKNTHKKHSDPFFLYKASYYNKIKIKIATKKTRFK